jgi:Family of unknown function (DUF6221)
VREGPQVMLPADDDGLTDADRKLRAFVAARIGEREQFARDMPHFTVPGQPFYSCPGSRTGPYGDLEWGEEHCDCYLADRRARALREVAAGRVLLDAHLKAHQAGEALAVEIAGGTLRAHADIWRDHPDYDPAWRPA